MIIEIIAWLSAIGLSVSGCLTFWKITEGWQFYRAIILALAGYAGGVVLSLILILLISLFFPTKKPATKFSKAANFILCQGLWFINKHGHAKIKWIGLDKLPKKERFLIVGNHRSNWDSMFVSIKCKNKEIGYISKPSNMKNPFIGRFAHNMCYQSIYKNDLMQSLGVIKHSIELIQNNVCSVGVFPEGKRQQELPIGEFHEGCFNIALKAKCPIVIICAKGTDNVHKYWPFNFKTRKVTMEIVGVIPYDDISTMPAKAVSDMVREILKNKMLQK